jgi:hypothetical protein
MYEDPAARIAAQIALGQSSLESLRFLCFLQLEGQGLLPFTINKQNLLLSSAIQIANQIGLPLLNFNVSSWRAAPAASSNNRQVVARCCSVARPEMTEYHVLRCIRIVNRSEGVFMWEVARLMTLGPATSWRLSQRQNIFSSGRGSQTAGNCCSRRTTACWSMCIRCCSRWATTRRQTSGTRCGPLARHPAGGVTCMAANMHIHAPWRLFLLRLLASALFSLVFTARMHHWIVQILTKNSVFLPTTTAKGLAMSGTFQNGTSFYVSSLSHLSSDFPQHPVLEEQRCQDQPVVHTYGAELYLAVLQYTRNHTLLGTAADPDDGRATFRPNDGTIIP